MSLVNCDAEILCVSSTRVVADARLASFDRSNPAFPTGNPGCAHDAVCVATVLLLSLTRFVSLIRVLDSCPWFGTCWLERL